MNIMCLMYLESIEVGFFSKINSANTDENFGGYVTSSYLAVSTLDNSWHLIY